MHFTALAILSIAALVSADGDSYGAPAPKPIGTAVAPVNAPAKEYGGAAPTSAVAAPAIPAKEYNGIASSAAAPVNTASKEYGATAQVLTVSVAAPVASPSKEYGGITLSVAAPAITPTKDYGVAPPTLKSTVKPVVTTPAYEPECEGEPSVTSSRAAVPVTPTPTPKNYGGLPATSKAPVLTNLVQSGAEKVAASFVVAAVGVAALFV
ncbi:hypothetical protein BC829DRAFT_401662 [Chytridium lagenaria]|nr:hypothetical protein BC829DRAFT_401662 [Chytridium lagenaria]